MEEDNLGLGRSSLPVDKNQLEDNNYLIKHTLDISRICVTFGLTFGTFPIASIVMHSNPAAMPAFKTKQVNTESSSYSSGFNTYRNNSYPAFKKCNRSNLPMS